MGRWWLWFGGDWGSERSLRGVEEALREYLDGIHLAYGNALGLNIFVFQFFKIVDLRRGGWP